MRAEGTLDRRAAVAELLVDRRDMLVVTGLGCPSYDVFDAGDHDANFSLWGAMGSAALVGLGVALSQPRRPVVVFTGDGEQLMGLGGLATIAVKRPTNLTIVVIDNGRFGETGMQLSHTAHGVGLDRVAGAMTFSDAEELTTLEQVAEYRPRLHRTRDGPRLANIRVSADSPKRVLPPRDGVYLKNRFRQHLGLAVT